MARGWESKSVEQQQDEANSAKTNRKPPLSPQQLAVHRERQGLMLSHSRLVEQLKAAVHPRHKEMLESSIRELEVQLERLASSQ
jgi:hypothetical protein